MLASIDNAKLCYVIAIIILVLCGVFALTQRMMLQGVVWIGVAIAVLGLWFSISP